MPSMKNCVDLENESVTKGAGPGYRRSSTDSNRIIWHLTVPSSKPRGRMYLLCRILALALAKAVGESLCWKIVIRIDCRLIPFSYGFVCLFASKEGLYTF